MTRELFDHPTTPAFDGWATFESAQYEVASIIEVAAEPFPYTYPATVAESAIVAAVRDRVAAEGTIVPGTVR
jgi:hypothetical protein